MTRYHCIIAYDGTDFSGYQVQPGKRTVQAELERVLNKMHGFDVKIIASGRTDAGVHAEGQSIHFDSDLQMACWQWKKALNVQLPDDIVVKKVAVAVDDFHARYDVVKKEYRYTVYNAEDPDPRLRHYVAHVPQRLDLSAMREAAQHLIGTHDFSSFCAANTSVVDKVRTIEMIEIVETNPVIVFRFVGTGFLYNMVRIAVGTLLEVGVGKRTPSEIVDILGACNREQAGKTAPAQGLCLWEVDY